MDSDRKSIVYAKDSRIRVFTMEVDRRSSLIDVRIGSGPAHDNAIKRWHLAELVRICIEKENWYHNQTPSQAKELKDGWEARARNHGFKFLGRYEGV